MVSMYQSIRRDLALSTYTPEKKAVEEELKELKRVKKDIKKIPFDVQRIFGISNDQERDTLSMLDDEIRYYEFYFEYLDKTKKEGFDEWKYLKKEQRLNAGEADYQVKGDCWRRDNGRIRVDIELERGFSTKVSIHIRKSSLYLDFYDGYRYDGKYEISSHLRNKESIDKRVEEYKQKADDMFREMMYPRYCFPKREMDALNKLLHIVIE